MFEKDIKCPFFDVKKCLKMAQFLEKFDVKKL